MDDGAGCRRNLRKESPEDLIVDQGTRNRLTQLQKLAIRQSKALPDDYILFAVQLGTMACCRPVSCIDSELGQKRKSRNVKVDFFSSSSFATFHLFDGFCSRLDLRNRDGIDHTDRR